MTTRYSSDSPWHLANYYHHCSMKGGYWEEASRSTRCATLFSRACCYNFRQKSCKCSVIAFSVCIDMHACVDVCVWCYLMIHILSCIISFVPTAVFHNKNFISVCCPQTSGPKFFTTCHDYWHYWLLPFYTTLSGFDLGRGLQHQQKAILVFIFFHTSS